MRRRLWISAWLLAAGCQALPTESIDCAASRRCSVVDFVLGQVNAATNGNLHSGLNQPYDALVAEGSLFVADCKNHRVLAWKAFPHSNNQTPDYVLGQPDFNTNLPSYGSVSASSMNCPGSLAYGKDKRSGNPHLAVGDLGNGRVLIWNGLPTSSYQPADVVVGQPEVTSSVAVNRAAATTVTYPSVAISSDGKLVVSDLLNSRVLVWNDIPDQDGKAADLVLGQPDLISGTKDNLTLLPSPNPAAWLDGPVGNPSADSSSLMVADTNNDRVLVWPSFPTTNGQPATQVLGQTSLGTTALNQAASDTTLNEPAGIIRTGNQLFVADALHNRVLGWNLPLPTTSTPAPASMVLGQLDMVSSLGAKAVLNASSLGRPHSVTADAEHLLVPDLDNNRVLIWNLSGLKSGQAANLVLGQPDFNSNLVNNVAKLGPATLNAPFGITGIGNQLIVSDQQNARLLLWPQIPQSAGEAPTGVWGHPDFAHGQPNTLLGASATNLCAPAGVATDGTRLFVADPCNHRVLIWNTIPASQEQPADVVVGQTTMSAISANGGAAINEHGLNGPLGVASDGQRLVVADTNNNRVLIWNTIPSRSGVSADLVLGQPVWTSNTLQDLSSTSLNAPGGVFFNGSQLLVADSGADRILIWNTLPKKSSAPADVAIGQTDFTNGRRLRPANKASLISPSAVSMLGNRLYVSDKGNHRVLYWNSLPTMNGQGADGYIGQPTFSDVNANNAGDPANPRLTGHTLFSPAGLFATPDLLFIADQGNNRIVVVSNPVLP